MTPKERVQAVLEHERPDRPVVDLGGRVASINVNCYLDLKDYLGLGRNWDKETTTLLNTVGEIDSRILEHFDVPFRRVYLKPPSTWKLKRKTDGSFAGEWGMRTSAARAVE